VTSVVPFARACAPCAPDAGVEHRRFVIKKNSTLALSNQSRARSTRYRSGVGWVLAADVLYGEVRRVGSWSKVAPYLSASQKWRQSNTGTSQSSAGIKGGHSLVKMAMFALSTRHWPTRPCPAPDNNAAPPPTPNNSTIRTTTTTSTTTPTTTLTPTATRATTTNGDVRALNQVRRRGRRR
jgi:hypothetical protein